MKKQNNTKAAEVKEQKVRKHHKFFLFADGKGFLKAGSGSDMPHFGDGELLEFESRSKAMFARDFFLKLNLAESIDVFTKVA